MLTLRAKVTTGEEQSSEMVKHAVIASVSLAATGQSLAGESPSGCGVSQGENEHGSNGSGNLRLPTQLERAEASFLDLDLQAGQSSPEGVCCEAP